MLKTGVMAAENSGLNYIFKYIKIFYKYFYQIIHFWRILCKIYFIFCLIFLLNRLLHLHKLSYLFHFNSASLSSYSNDNSAWPLLPQFKFSKV